jgi:hypothetical protein
MEIKVRSHGATSRRGMLQGHVARKRVTQSDNARRKQVAQALIDAWSHEATIHVTSRSVPKSGYEVFM